MRLWLILYRLREHGSVLHMNAKNRPTPVTFNTAEVEAIKTSVAIAEPGKIPCPRCNTLLTFDRDLVGGTALRCSECKRTCIVRRDLRD